ncbi:hypothetical protein CK203_069128 [Vitis vinifera]|uniref:Uncharacterized protein n=1 Tax=Vitis vinifera TaxID=29760 RepID=A0A438C2C2_VITVI|nr:hypothetical protein CK203_069128 [Vitis vinifera]
MGVFLMLRVELVVDFVRCFVLYLCTIEETHIDERSKELKSKDEIIAQKEKIVQEKSNSITQLQNEIVSLQKKGTSDAEEQLGKAYARASELEKQVDKLKKEIETQQKEKAALESRANEAERKTRELNSKVESLKKITDEQKTRIRKTERALQVAEEEMMKAKFDANSKTKELMEVTSAIGLVCHASNISLWLSSLWVAREFQDRANVLGRMKNPSKSTIERKKYNARGTTYETTHATTNLFSRVMLAELQLAYCCKNAYTVGLMQFQVHGAWLPPWFANHLISCQSFMEVHWNKHGKPALDTLTQKLHDSNFVPGAGEKAQAQKWSEPHVETFKTVAKKVSKPYIDQVAAVTKPHVDNVKVALKPYTKKVVRGYGKFLKSATTYHQKLRSVHAWGEGVRGRKEGRTMATNLTQREQELISIKKVQDTVQEKLKNHELTKPLATKELVWFAASALLALPIIFLFRICSAIFCKKAKKPIRNGHTNHHPRRKPKRGHPDK